MTESDRAALKRLLGGDASRRATTDDLQGLLLQVVFALLMVFMIAYFIFVEMSRKERAEEILEVNRQKLVLALEKVAEDHRVNTTWRSSPCKSSVVARREPSLPRSRFSAARSDSVMAYPLSAAAIRARRASVSTRASSAAFARRSSASISRLKNSTYSFWRVSKDCS